MALVYMHIAPNGKRYIGMTTCECANDRWRYGAGYNTQQLFNRAIKKYGWENFEHIIVADNLSLDEACDLEKSLIAKYHTTDANYGYNCCDGGNTNAGYHHSIESRKKMSDSKKGKPASNKGKSMSEEGRANISKAMKGKKKSQAWIEAHRKALKGHKVSDETRKKISEQNKQTWQNSSDEFKQEVRDRLIRSRQTRVYRLV